MGFHKKLSYYDIRFFENNSNNRFFYLFLYIRTRYICTQVNSYQFDQLVPNSNHTYFICIFIYFELYL